MNQIPLGKRSGFTVNRASIGGMRLPADIDEAVALLRHAIDSGMRYIDTSRGYGDSEIKIGKALKDGYREKVILSTKWSPWITKIDPSDDTSADCMRRRIEESMKRLDVDYLDYYQVWNIDSREHYDQAVARGGMVDGIRKAISDGIVGHTGFTTHDSVEHLLDYVKEVDWCEIILFSFNILNPRYAPAIRAASERGIGTIVMNPVAGGMLNNKSPVLDDVCRRAGVKSAPELGIRFLISHPFVDTAISGISKMSDVDDTIAAVNAGPLPADVLEDISSHLAGIYSRNQAFCTQCRYCMPCTKEIDIPAIMSMIAQYRFWGFTDSARNWYRDHKGPKADACVHCGKCEEHCTQHLKIMQEMDFATKNLA